MLRSLLKLLVMNKGGAPNAQLIKVNVPFDYHKPIYTDRSTRGLYPLPMGGSILGIELIGGGLLLVITSNIKWTLLLLGGGIVLSLLFGKYLKADAVEQSDQSEPSD